MKCSPKWRTGLPKKKGRYLTAHILDGNLMLCDVTDFYCKGDYMYMKRVNSDDSPAKQFLESLINPDYEVRAEKTGFVEITDFSHWFVDVDFWAELPKAPDGYTFLGDDDDGD